MFTKFGLQKTEICFYLSYRVMIGNFQLNVRLFVCEIDELWGLNGR